jgi:hypothetical protein
MNSCKGSWFREKPAFKYLDAHPVSHETSYFTHMNASQQWFPGYHRQL